MKSFKKGISAVLATCLAASTALMGCSGSGSASSAAAANTPAAGSSSAAAPASTEDNSNKETVTLKFWVAGTAQDQNKRIVEAVNKYLKDTLKSNIQVDYQELWWDNTTYGSKLGNALATGQDLDVCMLANWVGNYQQHAFNGDFLSLDDYLTKYPEISNILGQSLIDAEKINGHVYALPCNKEKFHSWGYLLRTDLVKKYNIDISKIKSEKDLEPYFDKILKGEPGIIPLCIQGFDVPGYHFLDWDNISDDDVPGALYPSSNGSTKIINQFVAKETLGIYKEMQEYLKKKYTSRSALTSTGISNDLKTGKYFSAVSSLKPGKDKEMQSSTGIDWTQVQITPNMITNRETLGALTAIPKSCKHPDEAMKFISLLYTDANLLNYFIYGVEGTDYTKNSDGTITPKNGSGYASGNGWRFGDQTKNLRLSYESADKYDQWTKINTSAPKTVSYGFIFNGTDKTTQSLIANTRAVVQTYYKGLLVGSYKDVDATVSEFDSKMKAAGSDKLIAEEQKQFDQWKSTSK